MKKIFRFSGLILLIVLLASIAFFHKTNSVIAGTIFFEDFESYNLGEFPYSGGWEILYSGSGSSSQYVDNTHAVSGSQSLHLVGSSCWAADIYHDLDVPQRVRLETRFLVDEIVSCGCTGALGHLGLRNLDTGGWFGSSLGVVVINCDGNLYAEGKNGVPLLPYNAGTWYHVRLDLDYTTGLFDVYIDGNLCASGVQLPTSGMPTAIGLSATHGGNPTIWFDDIKILTTSCCEGDFDCDGDVDGSDLAIFAGDFGRTDCPPCE